MSKMSIDLSEFPSSRLPLTRKTLSGNTMGTRYSAVFYAARGTDVDVLNDALFAAVDRVDRQMSSWKSDSSLNRLNAAPDNAWVDIPRELMTVLEASLQIECSTKGAFDIGVGKHVEAWGFGPAIQSAGLVQPPVTTGKPCHAASASLQLNHSEGRARKTAPITLDLAGIAKGYGVDEMGRVMNTFRIPSWLVGIDGEMRAKGAKPDGTMWAVAHERPDRHKREAMGVIELQDMAVATSGNYRHFREVGGRTVSHTMDPRTGAPLENDVASVSVLTPRCMTADAWATALMVMGVEAGLEAARGQGIDAIYVLRDGAVRSTL